MLTLMLALWLDFLSLYSTWLPLQAIALWLLISRGCLADVTLGLSSGLDFCFS